jgi:hypothetical protein
MRNACAFFLVSAALAVLTSPPLAGVEVSLSVTTSPTFFNPSLGQSGEIRVTTSVSGTAHVEILDRDRFHVRSLPPVAVEREAVLRWDGRDESGKVLPDEAYTVRIHLVTESGDAVHDPGKDFHPKPTSVPSASYSRADGVLSYHLDQPSRVHAQAGQARMVNGEADGPIIRTLVDSAPRSGGNIIEVWNGTDETGQVYIPDLPDFAVAALVVPLPQSTFIAVGNRSMRFVDYARQHRPPGDVRPRRLEPSQHGHHQGLNVFEDQGPALELTLLSSSGGGSWTVEGNKPLSFLVYLDASRAPFFLSQPTRVDVFLDSARAATLRCKASPCRVDLPLAKVAKGRHRVVVNWASDFGPVSIGLHLLEKK